MARNNISQQRILGEIKNLNKEKLTYLKAEPLEEDIYTWHFTFQGPENTEFHSGLYHGQILLPYEYPFKPPDIIFMNINGRFQPNTKICLTITQYHPQEWNSAWTIKTMLEAVISLFSENIQGLGSVVSSPQTKIYWANKSHSFSCDKCGILKDVLPPRQPTKLENMIKNQLPHLKQTTSEQQKIEESLFKFNRNVSQNAEEYVKDKKSFFNKINEKERKDQIKPNPIKKQQNKQNYTVKRIESSFDTNITRVTNIIKKIRKNQQQLDEVFHTARWIKP